MAVLSMLVVVVDVVVVVVVVVEDDEGGRGLHCQSAPGALGLRSMLM